eukprot:1741395-Pleurochrysis_carterae.AAC.1
MGASGLLRLTSSQEELLPYHTIRACYSLARGLGRHPSWRLMLNSPSAYTQITHVFGFVLDIQGVA